MSMPSFPPNGADMTREQALTMIIASVAMEELALSHILNAEGEKLQYVLGTLPGGCRPCASTQDVLAVNQSAAALLDVILQNQMLLKSKLERVLEAMGERCPLPCGPSCPEQDDDPCVRSAIRLVGQQDGFLWHKSCLIPWRSRSLQGDDIQWSAKNPARVCLNAQKAYAAHLWFNVRSVSPEGGTIFLRQTPLNAFAQMQPFCFPGCPEGTLRTLEFTALLIPQECPVPSVELSVLLSSQCALRVERASLDIVELW